MVPDSKIYPKMNKSNTALLVIDVVNGCAHEKCEIPEWKISFSKIREMVTRLREFIDDYRKIIAAPIIFVNITPWTKEKLPENINELYTDPDARYYAKENSCFAEKFYKVKPDAEDVIITKNSYDAFTNPELEKLLREKGIQYLVVTGIFTDGCVLATVANGFSAGFHFVMLADLIETTDDKERQELSALLKKRVFPLQYGKTIL